MAVILNNQQNRLLPPDVLSAAERAAQNALRMHGLPGDAEISLLLCDNETIRVLNRDWRGKDAVTDVLSFPLLDGDSSLPEGELLLGDIIISLERAGEQAREFGHTLEREFLYLFVHGLLHLLGYDHEDEEERLEMRGVEEEILAAVGATRDVP